MVETTYKFDVSTDIIRKKDDPISTQKAIIIPISNKDSNFVVDKAEVIIQGPDTKENLQMAKDELNKILVTHFGLQSRVIELTGSHEIPKAGTGPIKGKILMTSDTKVIAPEGSPGTKTLKVNVNASGNAETAILQYCEALTKDDKVIRFREMFKVIELLSSPDNTYDGLKKGSWSIPPEILQKAISEFNLSISNPEKELEELLRGTRNKWSHLKENYGYSPSDIIAIEETERVLPIMEEIVKYSLETNPKTRI